MFPIQISLTFNSAEDLTKAKGLVEQIQALFADKNEAKIEKATAAIASTKKQAQATVAQNGASSTPETSAVPLPPAEAAAPSEPAPAASAQPTAPVAAGDTRIAELEAMRESNPDEYGKQPEYKVVADAFLAYVKANSRDKGLAVLAPYMATNLKHVPADKLEEVHAVLKGGA